MQAGLGQAGIISEIFTSKSAYFQKILYYYNYNKIINYSNFQKYIYPNNNKKKGEYSDPDRAEVCDVQEGDRGQGVRGVPERYHGAPAMRAPQAYMPGHILGL